MNEDGKVVIMERCKRKINRVSEEDADTKRRR